MAETSVNIYYNNSNKIYHTPIQVSVSISNNTKQSNMNIELTRAWCKYINKYEKRH